MTFMKGDRVKRTGSDYNTVKHGETYTVLRMDGLWCFLEGIDFNFLIDNFELVEPFQLSEFSSNHSTSRPAESIGELTDIAPSVDLHAPGAKDDSQKPLPHLVLGSFANALSSVTEIGTAGAIKYSPKGWLYVDNAIERYREALFRHWLKMAAGEIYCSDSGQRHDAHIAWNSLAVLELVLLEEKNAKA